MLATPDQPPPFPVCLTRSYIQRHLHQRLRQPPTPIFIPPFLALSTILFAFCLDGTWTRIFERSFWWGLYAIRESLSAAHASDKNFNFSLPAHDCIGSRLCIADRFLVSQGYDSLYIYIYFFLFPLFRFFLLFFFLFTEFRKSRSGLRAEFLELAFLIRIKVFFFYNSLLIIKNCIPFLLFVSFFLSKNRMIIVYDWIIYR